MTPEDRAEQLMLLIESGNYSRPELCEFISFAIKTAINQVITPLAQQREDHHSIQMARLRQIGDQSKEIGQVMRALLSDLRHRAIAVGLLCNAVDRVLNDKLTSMPIEIDEELKECLATVRGVFTKTSGVESAPVDSHPPI